MSRTALLLLVVMLTRTESRPAQRIIDRVSILSSSGGLSSCDPSGNIDEVPFEPASVPLEDWLKGRKARQIPMKLTVREPQLRMDQQTAVFYEATVHLNSLKASQDRRIAFFVGVDGAEGRRLTETSVHAVNIPTEIHSDFDVAVRGCIYFRPGNYTLWIAAYDEATGKHSVERRNVRVAEIKNDPLPLLESQVPLARFPDYTPEETDLSKAIPTLLFVPVSNKRPLAVDIINLSPYGTDGIGPLTQMGLKDSSISVATLDLETQKVVYDSQATGGFDFTEMLKAAELHRRDRTIDLSVEIRRDSVSYLQKFLEQRIKSSDGKALVTLVVSSPLAFRRGSDLSAIQLDSSCECRLFYLQLYPQNGRDDLRKVLTSAQFRRLEVSSPLEFRKALASIIRELETF
jgi:hypothetical protein